MFAHVARFELRYQLRQPLFWTTAAVFAALAFVATTTDALQVGGAIGGLNRNAPFVVVRLLGHLSLLGVFAVVAFVATSVLRDFEHGTDELVFSRPIRTRDLLGGRFAGSLVATCGCFGFAVLGSFVGSFMPWLDVEKIGPRDVRPYLYGVAVLAFPTFTVLGAVFFALATRVRSMRAVYVALVGFLVAYFAGSALFGELENRGGAAWLDPFGLTAFELETRYWTVAERNTRLPAASGHLIQNRLLWLPLALGVLALAVSRFRYETRFRSRKRPPPVAESPSASRGRWMRVPPAFTPSTLWAQLRAQIGLETRAVLGSVPFLLILSFGLLNVLANMGQLELMFGTPVWPVTHLMLLAIRAGYSFLLVVILTFYAGELVWRERNLRLAGVFDALPVPTGIPLVAKLVALWIAAGVFIGAGMIGLIGFQLSHGHQRIEPVLYAQGFLVEIVPFLLTAALALFFQVVANQKFFGYLLMVLYLVSGAALTALHFDHYLYRFAAAPPPIYSDMNGWGHFAAPLFWFDLYWGFGAAVLLFLAYAGWVRGQGSRWKAARARLRGARWAVWLPLAGFVATGAFIFYNTNVLNEYVPSDEAERRYAEYERQYRRYRDLPQPRVVAVRLDVDLFPSERRADIRGTYRLVNRGAEPIPALHVSVSPQMTIRRLDLPPHRVSLEDRRLGYAIYELETPLVSGQEISFGFHLAISNPGFVNHDPDPSIVENGTLLTHRQFPAVGYLDFRQLIDPSRRRRQGLTPVLRMAGIDDLAARENHDLARDCDWADFETIVSTSPDQIAIAPGERLREWTEGGRRFFHYKMETKVPKVFAYLSARYTARRDSWKGIAIEVLHHPGHEYNVDRMIDATKKTLAYMTEAFSPYQHRHLRIVEFPRFRRFAASFPNTVPFSESLGFIARVQGPEALDYPFYVTAHEVAHQWWGYQVLGAAVQGSTMLGESMAQYSALMVMKKEYGPAAMRRFLKYELDRYLSGRGGELIEELPLELVENQPYIHYNKGSVALYALQDQIGEARLNEGLRRYVAAVRGQGPPYTVSRDLLAFVAEVTPPEKQGLLEDLFRSITLYDNEAVKAVARERPDGRYDVTLEAKARKVRADGKGLEVDVPLDDWIDIGVFGEGESVLYLQKHHVTGPAVVVETTVAGRPSTAGIDPFNTLIDRRPGDNLRAVR